MEPFNGYSVNEELKKNVEENLKGVTLVKQAEHRLAEVFTLAFRENFMNRPYYLWQEAASRSNWTYHTAFAIREAAQTPLFLPVVVYEVEGSGGVFELIRTIEILPKEIVLWGDLYF